MTAAPEIHGTCDDRLSKIEDAFARNFEDHGEVGASVAVMIDGEQVVDLWAGHADAERTQPWERDTIANAFSCTKGMVSTCLARLLGEGKLDPDEPVATYWPEFAQAGKEGITVRLLLSHQAGLSALTDLLPMGGIMDWDSVTEALAKQEPWWEPGSKHGYHAVSFGHLAGELVRRISGKSVGAYFREEIAEPLDVDFHIGLEADEMSRVSSVIPAEIPQPDLNDPLVKAFMDPTSVTFKSFFMCPDMFQPNFANTPEWRAAEIPGANGHGNARALSRVYGALARGGELDGVRVATSEAIDRATREEANGDDAVLIGLKMRIGLGFQLPVPGWELGRNANSFGHGGAGGSLGFADPDARIGFGYVMNKLIFGQDRANPQDRVDQRWPTLVGALYGSL
jgi:CubicO group peptidase (beta-lactamase class C family)